jgi:hypothetical protein
MPLHTFDLRPRLCPWNVGTIVSFLGLLNLGVSGLPAQVASIFFAVRTTQLGSGATPPPTAAPATITAPGPGWAYFIRLKAY